ncbi:uncharacterized protein LOC134801429 [Cydia splendana]|uniref:uncharacterized protein LOC134801429 n=1 Tax=Cydia splendana TaxID=1100963 RepID=UPI0028F4702D
MNKENSTNKWIDRVELVGKCYRLLLDEQPQTQKNASGLCEAEGARLVVLENEEEHNIVAEITEGVGDGYGFWTDYTRESNEDLFQTSDKETIHEVGYQKWSKELNLQDFARQWYMGIMLTPDECMYNIMKDVKTCFALCEKSISMEKIGLV